MYINYKILIGKNEEKEVNLLLNKAKLINGAGIELFPVPRNASYSKNPKETSIANESLVGFINARSQYISED